MKSARMKDGMKDNGGEKMQGAVECMKGCIDKDLETCD